MKFDCIVVGSHLRFDGVWQRPHHLAVRLAERVPVLFVEEPWLARSDSDAIETHGAIAVLRPKRSDPSAVEIDDATVAAVRAWVAGRHVLVWLETPMMDRLANAFAAEPVVYDCMDDLGSFARAPVSLRAREALLLERARLVFTGGRSLFERCRSYGPKVRLFASGVEFARFASARTAAPHPLFAHLGRPVCGYAGVIDERIDWALLAALAERAVELVLVGPVMKIEGTPLPRRPNVHFTGQLPYGELPSLLAGFDVALMPFAHNAATATISPTKTPEYLAAGKPVVSTRIADVVAGYEGIVWFADAPEDFADACLAAALGDPERARRGMELARTADWDAIAARMWRDLEGE